MRHVIVWATEEYVLAVDSGDIPFTFNKSLEEVRKTFSTLAHDPPEHTHIGSRTRLRAYGPIRTRARAKCQTHAQACRTRIEIKHRTGVDCNA